MFVTSVYYMIGCDFLLNKCVAYLLLVWEMLKPRLRFSVYALCLLTWSGLPSKVFIGHPQYYFFSLFSLLYFTSKILTLCRRSKSIDTYSFVCM